MLGFLTRYAKTIIAIFALAVFALTQSSYFQSFISFQRIEGSLHDFRFGVRGARAVDPDVVLVGIRASSLGLNGTESTISEEEIQASEALQWMRKPFPWNRKVYARVLERLVQAGAKVVVFDFVFKGETDGDDDFARVLDKYKNKVVIGSMFSSATDTLGRTFKTYTPPSPSLLLNPTNPVVGYVNFWPEIDDVVRKQKFRTSQLFEAEGMSDPNEDLHALSALAVEKYLNASIGIPTEYRYVDFLGPRNTFRALPIEEMFVEPLWQSNPFYGGKVFEGKIVVVGPMAEIFQDIHDTPYGTVPGPEIQANLISNLLHNSFYQASSPLFNAFVTCATIAIALMVCLVIRNVVLKGALLVMVAVGFFASCQFAFSKSHMIIGMFPPLFGLITTGAFGIFFQYVLEWFERHRINNVLEKYVSKNVAKTILKNPHSFVESLTGRKQKVAILFCDIRGFTTMTESAEATELVKQLNEYFSKMVHIIEEEKGGTLQKFIGDAIMAAWGDTVVRGGETDVRLSIETALAMREALKKLNEGWKDKPNRQQLSIGIGINYGEVVVGNIGSSNRMEFTVLGDGINLAARFESSTKQFHTDLLVGEAAEALVREQFVFRKLGLITFKGKTKPVEVFGVLSDLTVPAPAWLATYHEGILLFRQREFVAASERFRCAEEMIGAEDFLCQMYLRACKELHQEPPPEGWDGVFVLKEK